MSAIIQSSIPAKPVNIGVSRDDLRPGEVVTLQAFDLSHSTYAWTLADSPETADNTPSVAVLSATVGPGPITFQADNEGTYLIRLIVDQGLLTEDTQFIAIRMLTIFGDLKILAAGERRDATGVIPVDAEAEGWASIQNRNHLKMLAFMKKVSTSGRTLSVDANRGLDSANAPNDETIAEGYADHSTISAAITAANLMVPAPSLTDPVVIKVFPGYYVENLNFAPHVHVVAVEEGTPYEADRSVVVRTDPGGVPVHTAAITGAGQSTFVSGIFLENTEISTDPVLRKTGDGTLYLHRCSIIQNGNDALQGPAYTHQGGLVIGKSCIVKSNVTTALDRVAILQDTTATDMLWEDCEIVGPSGVDLAPSDLPNMNSIFRYCRIDATYVDANTWGIRANSEELRVEYCDITQSGGLSSNSITIHPGAGVHGSNIIVEVRWTRLEGDLSFDTTGVVGNTRLRMGATEFGGALNITGALTEEAAIVEGFTIFYDNSVTTITATNVQDAIDHIFNVVGITGLGGYAQTLDTAYDGVNPITAIPGAGSGRKILADSGAVVIQAADPPAATPVVGQTDGWLQVEGNIQSGGIGSPEVDIDPNPFGTGPKISGGSLIYPDIAASPHRAIPAFVVRANNTGAALYHSYNLLVETASEANASRDEIGRVLIKAGDSLPGGGTPPLSGQVYLQAGEGHDITGDPGEIWLSPGRNDTLATNGRVRITNPTAATVATLQALGVFVGGVAGDIAFYVSGVGLVTATIIGADTLTTVQTKLNALPGVFCDVNIANNPITVETLAKGVNAEIYFVYDTVGNALNTALGDFSIGSGAVFVPGTFGENVSFGATGPDEMTVYGDLLVTGAVSGSGAFQVNRKTISIVDSPYAVLDTDHYIGVDTSGGPITINLPVALPGTNNGRELIIKDESGNAGANPINIAIAGGALIDGLPALPLGLNFASATLVANGQIGAATRFYIV